MERQAYIDWSAESSRRTLEACGLSRLEIEICILFAAGTKREVEGELRTELKISKRNAGKRLRCSPNGFVKAAERLIERGLAARVDCGRSTVWLLSLDRIGQLEPPEKIADHAVFRGGWSPVVTGGHFFTRNRRQEEINTSRKPCTEVPSTVTGEKVTTGDHLVTGLERSARPWSDLTDDHLLTIHRDGRAFVRICRRLFQSARTGTGCPSWLAYQPDDDAARHEASRKFLAICHYAATTRLGPRPDACKTLNRRVAILISRVKRGEFGHVNQACWDWAARVLAAKQKVSDRGRDLAAAMRARCAEPAERTSRELLAELARTGEV